MADIQALNKKKIKRKNHNSIHFLSSASFTNFSSTIPRGQNKKGIKSPAVLSAVHIGGAGMLGGLVGAGIPMDQPPWPLGSLLSLGRAGERRPPRPPKWCQFWKMAFDNPIKLSWSDQKGPPETGRLTRSRKSKETIHLAATKFSKRPSLESNRIRWYQIFSLSTAYVEPGWFLPFFFIHLSYRKM